MGLYDVPMFMSLFGFGIGMMFASFHVCESKWSYVLEVPDVEFIGPCGVVVFAMFYCRLDLCCSE